jgi:hypothetical protein
MWKIYILNSTSSADDSWEYIDISSSNIKDLFDYALDNINDLHKDFPDDYPNMNDYIIVDQNFKDIDFFNNDNFYIFKMPDLVDTNNIVKLMIHPDHAMIAVWSTTVHKKFLIVNGLSFGNTSEEDSDNIEEDSDEIVSENSGDNFKESSYNENIYNNKINLCSPWWTGKLEQAIARGIRPKSHNSI